jgi:hypothetical protein
MTQVEKLLTCIRVRISTGTLTILSEIFRTFSPPSGKFRDCTLKFVHKGSLPHIFPVHYSLASNHIARAADSIIKQTMK